MNQTNQHQKGLRFSQYTVCLSDCGLQTREQLISLPLFLSILSLFLMCTVAFLPLARHAFSGDRVTATQIPYLDSEGYLKGQDIAGGSHVSIWYLWFSA